MPPIFSAVIFMKDYLTVKGVFESEKVIERSRFICYLKGVNGREDAETFVARIKKKNSLATHNCYAFIADGDGQIRKFSDDGEPQGTAGAPILDALSSAGLCSVVAVVTRYFGGVKLGTGGLCRAYFSTAAECVKTAKKVWVRYCRVFSLRCDYTAYQKIVSLLNGEECRVDESGFSDFVTATVCVPVGSADGFMKKIKDLTGGRAEITPTGEAYREFGE